MLEGLVIAWGAQSFYQIWSRLYSFVRVRLPWQPKAEVEADVEVDVEVQPKRVSRPRQAAIDARNDYKTVCCCN